MLEQCRRRFPTHHVLGELIFAQKVLSFSTDVEKKNIRQLRQEYVKLVLSILFVSYSVLELENGDFGNLSQIKSCYSGWLCARLLRDVIDGNLKPDSNLVDECLHCIAQGLELGTILDASEVEVLFVVQMICLKTRRKFKFNHEEFDFESQLEEEIFSLLCKATDLHTSGKHFQTLSANFQQSILNGLQGLANVTWDDSSAMSFNYLRNISEISELSLFEIITLCTLPKDFEGAFRQEGRFVEV